jgi:diguanylate cyclase (GGDEF)-like protein
MLVEGQRRLLEVSRSVLASLDPAEVLELIADSVASLVPHDGMQILETDWATRTFRAVVMRASSDEPGDREAFMRTAISIDAGIAGWVIRTGEPLNLVDGGKDPRALLGPGTYDGPDQIIAVPLVQGKVVAGAMLVHRKAGADEAFSAAEFDLIQLFASLASIALQNAQAHRAVVFAADTDALTGLFNHGAFQRDIRVLVERGPDEPFALLLLDLDRFKAYDDTHGHPAGDGLLQGVAGAIRSSSRERDRAYRYGGDEFALLLRNADPVDARIVADRVGSAIAALTIGHDVEVTASVGVACSPTDADTADALVAVADRAQYLVKARHHGSAAS